MAVASMLLLLATFSVGHTKTGSQASGQPPQKTSTEKTGKKALATKQAEPPKLVLDEALRLALTQNPAILKAKKEIERRHGVTMETRALALPTVQINSDVTHTDAYLLKTIDPPLRPTQAQWEVSLQVQKTVFDAGAARSNIRAAKLSEEAALYDMQEAVLATLRQTRVAFYQVLLNRAMIRVQEESVRLLQEEWETQRDKFEAGTAPRFNVLRAEVEHANAQPQLIRARNNYRLALQDLARLLAVDIGSRSSLDFTTFRVVGELDAPKIKIPSIAELIQKAEKDRPLLKRMQNLVLQEKAGISVARAGLFPKISAFAAYGYTKEETSSHLGANDGGYTAGLRGSWDVFDGLATQGKIEQSKARFQSAEVEMADAKRQVEIDVREAYSRLIEAIELIESQGKVVEQADESLRLAKSRFDVGSGTQLDVLNAQVSLTRARSTQLEARFDCHKAIAALNNAVGQGIVFSRAD